MAVACGAGGSAMLAIAVVIATLFIVQRAPRAVAGGKFT